MLVIRFRRTGKKNKPTYRIVVAEHSWPVDGKFTADLGFYNPHTKLTSLKAEEVKLWLDKGAKPSNSAAKLMVKEKIKHNSVVVVKKNKKSRQVEEVGTSSKETTAAPVEETPETTTPEADQPVAEVSETSEATE